jgi:hypothetical protein
MHGSSHLHFDHRLKIAGGVVRGLATLWLAGNIAGLGDDPEAITRVVASRLRVGRP